MRSGKMGLVAATSLGVGTMIGASIFTIFGVGARIAGPDLPLAFLLSSTLALMVGYSYARLSAAITSNAGPIGFILQAMGDGLAAGTLSLLMWLSYVISIALFLEGFAGYLLPLLGLEPTPVAQGVAEALTISAFTGLGFFGAKAVGKAELVIVAVKLAILALLVVAGIGLVDPGRVRPTSEHGFGIGTLFAASLFFLSYMGFGLITNAAEDIEDPTRTVPRAIYASIAIVTVVYVMVAVVVIGNLPLSEVVQSGENALAEAARPALGRLGFGILSVGALFSISSALNATLYGGANVAYTLARDGELPALFERKLWLQSTGGLLVTAGLGLALALFLDVDGIASITSAVFIVIYLFVIASHLRLVERVGGHRPLIVFDLIVVLATLVVLLVHQYRQDRLVLAGLIALFGLSVVAELVYRRVSGRTLRAPGAT
jgi:amino acid transporter